jgi:phenylpropionate dioxygenase-like ring-hydroxylating dioxygenase large terminal subunit
VNPVAEQRFRSPTYDPGPFSLAHESGVGQFLDWYVSRLQVQKAFDHVA